MGGRERTVWFMSSNERPHTLGVTSVPGRGRLIHLMVEAATFDDVGLALDRREKYDIPPMYTLGQHTHHPMTALYPHPPEWFPQWFGHAGLPPRGRPPPAEHPPSPPPG